MCFRVTGYNKFSINSLHFEVLSVNTTTSTGRGMYAFEDNSALAPRNLA